MSESGFPRKATNRSATTRHLKLASGLAVAALVAGPGAAWAGAGPHGAASSVLAAASRNGAGTLGVGARAEGRPMEVFGPDDFPDEPVTVAKGGTLVVHLAEAAGSTGHSWSMSLTGSSLELTDDDVTEAGENRPGAAGEHTFTFRARRSGSTTLTFDLARADDSPATTLALIVNVDKASPRPTPPAPVVDVHGPGGLPGQPVEVDAGSILAVHLTEQAGSTGYSWSPIGVPKNLIFLKDKVVPGAGRPGAAGEHVFTYRVAEARKGSLTFALTRAGRSRAKQTVTVRIAPPQARRTITLNGPKGLPSSAVKACKGDQIVVHLTEQAGSTGYSWSPAKVPGNLTLVADTYVAGPSVPGAPGDHIFTFRVDGPGEGTLSFGLARPWEPAPVDQASVTIAVKR